jgi:hypothetical protein
MPEGFTRAVKLKSPWTKGAQAISVSRKHVYFSYAVVQNIEKEHPVPLAVDFGISADGNQLFTIFYDTYDDPRHFAINHPNRGRSGYSLHSADTFYQLERRGPPLLRSTGERIVLTLVDWSYPSLLFARAPRRK